MVPSYLKQILISVGRDQAEDVFLFHVITGDLDDRASYWDWLNDVVITVTRILVAEQTVTFEDSVHRFPCSSVHFL